MRPPVTRPRGATYSARMSEELYGRSRLIDIAKTMRKTAVACTGNSLRMKGVGRIVRMEENQIEIIISRSSTASASIVEEKTGTWNSGNISLGMLINIVSRWNNREHGINPYYTTAITIYTALFIGLPIVQYS